MGQLSLTALSIWSRWWCLFNHWSSVLTQIVVTSAVLTLKISTSAVLNWCHCLEVAPSVTNQAGCSGHSTQVCSMVSTALLSSVSTTTVHCTPLYNTVHHCTPLYTTTRHTVLLMLNKMIAGSSDLWHSVTSQPVHCIQHQAASTLNNNISY